MRKLVLSIAAALVMAGTFAFAQSWFTIDDAAVRYDRPTASNESPRGHLQFAHEAGGLTIVLSRSELDGSLPAFRMVVPDRGEDQFGESRPVTIAHLEGVEVNTIGGVTPTFMVTHPNQVLEDVVQAYEEALTELGFTAVVDTEDLGLVVSEFHNGDASLRAVFREDEGGVRVHLEAI